jgi:hypothetical protein
MYIVLIIDIHMNTINTINNIIVNERAAQNTHVVITPVPMPATQLSSCFLQTHHTSTVQWKTMISLNTPLHSLKRLGLSSRTPIGYNRLLLDQIFSYLDWTTKLRIIEHVSRVWSHASREHGCGWHTLHLESGSFDPAISYRMALTPLLGPGRCQRMLRSTASIAAAPLRVAVPTTQARAELPS